MDAKAVHAQALDLYRAGSVRESLSSFEQARAEFLAQGNQVQAAEVANDLGVVYYTQGRRDDARKIFDEAIAVFEQAGEIKGQARAIGNLAQVMNRAGEKNGAEKNYTRAAELFHLAGERTFESDTYRALSQMQLQRGRWLEALAAYDSALAAKGGSGLLRAFLQIPLRLTGVRRS